MIVPTYRSAQATDGTWTIFRVPIFAAHTEKRAKGNAKYDKGWLEAALSTAKVRQAEGYMAPLHVGHHEGEPVGAAGFFRMVEVGEIMHGGQSVPALFADFVGVKPEVYRKIRKGQLSYRSVEILNVSKAEIDSLALLDDEVPFFRFPLLRVAEDEPSASVHLAVRGTPALAFSARGQSVATLFKFEETMADEKDPEAADGDAPKEDESKKNALEEGLKAMLDILQGLLGSGDESKEDPGPAEQPVPAMASATPVAAGFSAAPELPELPVDLSDQGEKDALLMRVKSLEFSAARLAQGVEVDKKAAALVAAGYSTDQVTAFRGAAKQHGLKAALSYAAGMERMGPSDPPTHWTGEIHSEAPDSPEIAKFGAKGPEALAEARDLFGSYTRTKPDMSFADYHAANTEGLDWVANH